MVDDPRAAHSYASNGRRWTDEWREANLARLRKENTELRRTLTLYEEAIRQLALENEALRTGATVIPLQAQHRRISPPSS